MSERPAPPWEAPEGREHVAVLSESWRLVTGKLCRRMGAGHQVCRKAAVAELIRTSIVNRQGNWWAYCADHMYGNWIEDGQVMRWILREIGGA